MARAAFNRVIGELEEVRMFNLISEYPQHQLKMIQDTKRYEEHASRPAEYEKGTCFEENLRVFAIMRNKGARFMIGELRSKLSDWADVDEGRGMVIQHAWVEVGDMVYDRSNGNKVILPTEVFYAKFRVKRAEELRFIKDAKKINTDKGGYTIRLTPDEHQLNAFNDYIRNKQRQLGRR
jgi:hypothetical protein